MKDVRRASKFICTECDLAFEIFNPSALGRNGRKHCPGCGDYFFVRVLKVEKKPGEDWDDYEIEKLDQHINGDIKLYALSHLLGRSEKAISIQKSRRITQLEMPRTFRKWSDEEKALADKCINGEIDLMELSKTVGRSHKGVQRFVERRIKKQKEKQGVFA